MPKLSAIVPVYNEKETVVELIERTRRVPVDKEIVVIDDGSSDGTSALLQKQYSNTEGVKLLFHKKNQGKGSAIRTGIAAATGDILIMQDADLEYDPQDFLTILRKFDDKAVHVVYGSRFQGYKKRDFIKMWVQNRFFGAKHEIKRLHLFFGVQTLNLLANILFSAKITDEATCYKAFRREVLSKISLKCKRFEFCPEVTAKVRKAGYIIHEVPISYHPRSAQEGKKLNWTDGFDAIWTLIKYRFVS